MVKSNVADPSHSLLAPVESTPSRPAIRLIAADIDGTLLNHEFHISDGDLAALRRAHGEGVEVMLVTGRRHDFALPIAKMLGFDLWIASSNGAITRSLTGETFHKDFLPAAVCRELCEKTQEFRGHNVLTFDTGGKGAIVLEHMDELSESIQRWLEKNLEYIDFVIPVEKSLTRDPVQSMYCGRIARMQEVLRAIEQTGLPVTVLRTEYAVRDLSIVDVLNQGCSKGHALERWATHRGIGREQVMAIGDNYNDIEMLEFAGHPFVMANASEDLRGRGWNLTLSNSECGVAAAVSRMMGW